jgi:hypothetical protein
MAYRGADRGVQHLRCGATTAIWYHWRRTAIRRVEVSVRTDRADTLAGASSFVSTMRCTRLVRPIHLERSLLESLPVGSLE